MNSEQKPHDNLKIWYGLTLGLLVLAVLGTFFLVRRGEGGDSDSSSSFASFAPIYIVVFIPLMVKRVKQMDPKQRRLIRIAVMVGVSILLLGWLVFFLSLL